jgi:hypothetical protein
VPSVISLFFFGVYTLIMPRFVSMFVCPAVSLLCPLKGKAGGLLALDWNTGAVDALARISFRLHESLATELQRDIGYRRMNWCDNEQT